MSLRRGQILINSRRLETEIEAKQLKVWWIAEQIRVDRKTISRWLAGTSKAATKDNIRALAAVLECPFEALCVDEAQDEARPPQPKAVAAELIREKGLKDLLEPSHNHALLEALLSASIDPNLPPDTLAVLLLDLAHAQMRQHRYQEAEGHVHHALKLLMDSSDALLRARSRMALANVLSLQSKPIEALDHHDLATELARAPGDNLILAKALSNHAHAFLTLGQYQEAEELVTEALGVHERLRAETGKLDVSNCTALRVAALIAFPLGRKDKARAYLQQALPLARELKYRYGEVLALLFDTYAETLEAKPCPGCREDLLRYLREIESLSHHPDACQYTVYGLLQVGEGEAALDVAQKSLAIFTSPADDALKNIDVADAEWFLGRKDFARQRVREAEKTLRALGYEKRAAQARLKLQNWQDQAGF